MADKRGGEIQFQYDEVDLAFCVDLEIPFIYAIDLCFLSEAALAQREYRWLTLATQLISAYILICESTHAAWSLDIHVPLYVSNGSTYSSTNKYSSMRSSTPGGQ